MDNIPAEQRFLDIGLDPKVAKNTVANKAVTAKLLKVLEVGKIEKCDKSKGNLLYQVATKLPASCEKFLDEVTQYIAEDKLKTQAQLDAAFEFLKKRAHEAELDRKGLEAECGVGVVVSQEEIKEAVKKVVQKNKDQILERGYTFPSGLIMAGVKEHHKWADTKHVMAEIEAAYLELLGPKNEQNTKVLDKKEMKKKGKEEDKKVEKKPENEAKEEKKVEEPPKEKILTLIGRDMHTAVNPPHILEAHNKITEGKIFTRFPPEPNGYLHIGHAKAMRFNFTTASENGGHCYLRFDDTNPEKESQEYIDNIKENVNWLGYTPYKVTHASDCFEELYNFAVELIRRGKAYVDHLSKEEMQHQRGNMIESPYRNRPIEESLKLFDNMRKGLYAENEVCLRMKIDMKNANPCMRDPVAYRIRYHPHPHAGDKWCIYPTYDFTHCLNDSLEHITHSLCTLEFEIRRDTYYWLLEALDVWRPAVWEYSRLNLTRTVMSKRKLQKMVFEHHVRGWDDPRMPTLNGLRRRGYTAQAINEFCDLVGVTRRGNDNFISIKLLEHCIRKDLNEKAPRTFAVIDPLKIVITNVPDDFKKDIEAPIFPNDKTKGTQTYTITKELFIERTDFREVADKEFFGLTKTQVVCLKYGPYIQFEELVLKHGSETEIDHIKMKLLEKVDKKIKGYIHWVPAKLSVQAEVRLYDYLFKSENPDEHKNFLSDFNPDSEVIKYNARIMPNLTDIKHLDKFQFERVGFFSVDYDTDAKNKKFVFNRTVTLVESKDKPPVGDKAEAK